MEQKNYQTLEVDKKYLDDILDFCRLNDIEDINHFVNLCFKQGFDIKKYGLLNNEDEIKIVEKEIIKYVDREIIKEVPVEKIIENIKEVEKIIEVPVEVIKEVIVEKEVPVEKIVTIYDKSNDKELFGKIEQLENEISKKDEELDILRHLNDEKPKNDRSQMLQDTLNKVRSESLQKDEIIKQLEERINKINNQLGGQKAVYHQDSNLKNKI